MRLSLHRLDIPFRQSFRHAAAERVCTETVIAVARGGSGCVGYGEGCPRSYVTGETLDSTRAFFREARAEVVREVRDVDTLRAWVVARRDLIDRNPAAWCAIELALLDLFGRQIGRSVETLLDRSALAGMFRYTAVIGDAEPKAFSAWFERYRMAGFWDFKIKLAGDPRRDRAKLDTLRAIEDARLRVRCDANNLWGKADDAVAHLRALNYGFLAVEEPLAPGDWEGLQRVADTLGVRVILDESVTRAGQIERLGSRPERWLVNVRVSKMGGVLRALEVIERARQMGVGVIVGAQVGETSLLTRASLTVAHAARDIVIAQEGAFGTMLLESDICTPPLMFGVAGLLDAAALPTAPGWGLDVVLPQGAVANA
jgi:L-Ala-D/L-Glu epimerase